MDCEECPHLMVVGLHDTGPWSSGCGGGGGAEGLRGGGGSGRDRTGSVGSVLDLLCCMKRRRGFEPPMNLYVRGEGEGYGERGARRVRDSSVGSV